MVRVKICGITNWDDAKLAIEAGAHALGFNFYPPSPRSLTPAEAWAIIRRLPPLVETVGVFVNWSSATMEVLASALHLHAIQLHGEETPGTVAACRKVYPVIKAFRVRPGFRPSSLAMYPAASAFLLDGFKRHVRGGTGRSFDWSTARRARRYGKIIVAGGLSAENVAQAIREAQPFALDVCSGVESRPGKKDSARLRALMSEVERANARWNGRPLAARSR